ncbi:hypothetical protein ACIQC5_22125 [Paenarthrobacter sp. NPDC092416]|uniref:hypothetical protein n=1 Tax=Paenarthrobacter sp. NPDC092416 TaxID=3364386 RepID=UPI003800C134
MLPTSKHGTTTNASRRFTRNSRAEKLPPTLSRSWLLASAAAEADLQAALEPKPRH